MYRLQQNVYMSTLAKERKTTLHVIYTGPGKSIQTTTVASIWRVQWWVRLQTPGFGVKGLWRRAAEGSGEVTAAGLRLFEVGLVCLLFVWDDDLNGERETAMKKVGNLVLQTYRNEVCWWLDFH